MSNAIKLNRSRKLLSIFLYIPFCLLFINSSLVAVIMSDSNTPQTYKQGEILVKYKNTVSLNKKINSISAKGDSRFKTFSPRKITRVKLSDNKTVEEGLAQYNSDPLVEYAQPNYIYRAVLVPNDGSYGQLWGLQNAGQTITDPDYTTNNPGTSGFDMDLESAWDVITDCSSVIVAVIDTGVNYNHEDISANMWNDGSGDHGYDFIDDDNDPMDMDGHGTHVAGTIGAVGNNVTGITGVCWQTQIMAVRALDASGSGTTASIIPSIEYAVDNGAQVINMSLGGNNSFDQAYSDSISYARDNGTLVVAAAGNGGPDGLGDDNDADAHYPSSFTQDNIISVAALDQAYALASFSNYGAASVDVGAPGTNILSTFAGSENTVTEDFSGDWTKEGGWTEGSYTIPFYGGSYDMLVNPSNWGAGTYALSVDETAYKSFDLSAYDSAVLDFYAVFEFETYYDGVIIYANNVSGDPVSAVNELVGITGSSFGYPYNFVFDISNKISSASTIGFRLISDFIIVYDGIGIVEFTIQTLTLAADQYVVYSGTSMAAPHVSGLAAMLAAYNPDYTYADVANSILNGGDDALALSGKTTTGKAVDAWGSLCYIDQPTGVTLGVESN